MVHSTSKKYQKAEFKCDTYKCIASTPALAQADGTTKPDPQYCAYVAVIPRKAAPT